VVAVVVLGLVTGATTASAHDTLASTDPADGSTVAVAPAAVTLVFNEPAQALGSQIRVTGPDGSVVSTGDVVLNGASVSERLVDSRPAGTYTVAWRITSTDGHPISGSFTFSATGAAGPAPAAATPAPTSTAAATMAPTTAPTTSSTGDTVIAPSPTPSAGTGSSAGLSPGLVAGIVILVAGVGAAGILVARRRSR
jgi:copper resistance protein C